MAEKDAEKVLQRLQSDAELREKIQAAQTREERLALLVEVGLTPPTRQEMLDLLGPAVSGELSQEELEAIAGGEDSTVSYAASATAASVAVTIEVSVAVSAAA